MNYGNQRHKGNNQDEKALHGASLEIELFEIAQLHATCVASPRSFTLPTGTNILLGQICHNARMKLAAVHAGVKIYRLIYGIVGDVVATQA